MKRFWLIVFLVVVGLGVWSCYATAACPNRVCTCDGMGTPIDNGTCLSDAIARATFGDVIALECGRAYETRTAWALPEKGPGTGTDADYITIQPTPDCFSKLQPTGTRIDPPRDHAFMPKLIGTEALFLDGGAGTHHWKWVGLEMTTSTKNQAGIAFLIGTSANYTQASTTKKGWWIERSWIHPGENTHTDMTMKQRTSLRSGMFFFANEITVRDSYIQATGPQMLNGEASDGTAVGCDSYCENLLVENNYIESAFNNLFFGGADGPPKPEHTGVVQASPSPTKSAVMLDKTTGITVGTLVAFEMRTIAEVTDAASGYPLYTWRWGVGRVTAVDHGTHAVQFTPLANARPSIAPAVGAVDHPGGYAAHTGTIHVDGALAGYGGQQPAYLAEAYNPGYNVGYRVTIAGDPTIYTLVLANVDFTAGSDAADLQIAKMITNAHIDNPAGYSAGATAVHITGVADGVQMFAGERFIVHAHGGMLPNVYTLTAHATFAGGQADLTFKPGLSANVGPNADVTLYLGLQQAVPDNAAVTLKSNPGSGYQDFDIAPRVGGAALWDGAVVKNVTIRGNTISGWPASLATCCPGTGHKAWSEIKQADGMVWEANIFTEDIGSGRSGTVALYTQNQNGSFPWARVSNVVFRNNWWRNFNGFIVGFGGYNVHDMTASTNNSMTNNMMEGASAQDTSGIGSQAIRALLGGSNFLWDHNTVVGLTAGRSVLAYPTTMAAIDTVIRNSIFQVRPYGFNCVNFGQMRPECFKTFTVTHNLLIDDTHQGVPLLQSLYPNNTVLADPADIGYRNLAARDYRLATDSRWSRAATDATSIGANLDLIRQAMGATQWARLGLSWTPVGEVLPPVR